MIVEQRHSQQENMLRDTAHAEAYAVGMVRWLLGLFAFCTAFFVGWRLPHIQAAYDLPLRSLDIRQWLVLGVLALVAAWGFRIVAKWTGLSTSNCAYSFHRQLNWTVLQLSAVWTGASMSLAVRGMPFELSQLLLGLTGLLVADQVILGGAAWLRLLWMRWVGRRVVESVSGGQRGRRKALA